MERAAVCVACLTLAFWVGALVDHVVSGQCGSDRCLLKMMLE